MKSADRFAALARLAEEVRAADSFPNPFLAGVLEDTAIVSSLTPRRLTRAECLNLAAWLVAIADESPGPVPHPLVSEAFLKLVNAVHLSRGFRRLPRGAAP
jgi:hypothetical protein